jgi:hypothetical protein
VDAPDIAPYEFAVKNNKLVFSTSGKLTGEIAVFTGNGKLISNIIFSDLNPVTQSISLPGLAPGLNILRLTLNNTASSCQVLRVGNELYLQQNVSGNRNCGAFQLTKSAAAVKDTLIATKAQFSDKKVFITSYDTTVAIQMDTLGGVCTVPNVPEFSALKEITEFPDPFLKMDGNRITKKSEWNCRREEIKALAQKFIYGQKPPKPDKIEASFSGKTLTVKVTVGSTTKSFTADISGNSGTGLIPGIIVVGASFGAPVAVYSTPSGVATITFSEQQFAKSGVSGRKAPSGIFYDLWPSYKTTGALMAWAWGTGCLIDALEQEDIKTATKIDPAKLGITGCSFAGKAALSIGAWEERIALTLPIESGAGGFVAWRYAQDFKAPDGSQNGCQYASEAYGEAEWMGDAFQQFGSAVKKLPVDMHSIAALCAPRGLLATQALTAWLCPKGGWLAGCATHMVYDALGSPDNMGYLVATTPQHCQKGNTELKEQDTYNAFVKKFLQGDNTAKTSPDVALKNTQNYSEADSKYIPWTKPTLQ